MIRLLFSILAVLSSTFGFYSPYKNGLPATTSSRPGIDTYQTVTNAGRFRLHIEPRTYADAAQECENEEAYLAIPSSKAIEEAMVKILRSSTWLLAYVGINDIQIEGRMVTVLGQPWSEVAYTRWEDGEPNDASDFGGEDCVIITRNALLNDWNCTEALAYFCQKYDPRNAIVSPNAEQDSEVNSADCGTRSELGVNPLVVRGVNTIKGDWPWMAAIFTTSDWKFRCGGSLISRRFVVTAAHCVAAARNQPMSPSTLIVHLGRYNLSRDERDDVQVMEIDQIMVSPVFTTSDRLEFDISLLLLKNSAIINSFVRTVCLWDDSLGVSHDDLVGKVGMAPGWGKDENDVLSPVLKVAGMPVVSQYDCLESSRDFFGAYISKTTLCAGFQNGTSVCNGDSGGGLHFYRLNPKTGKMAWFVRGIVSLSKMNELYSCDPNKYVLFTDTANVQEWMKPILVNSGGYQFPSFLSPSTVTQFPVRPPNRPTTRPTPRPSTADYYDLLYLEDEEMYDIELQYEVNSADCGQPYLSGVNTLVVRGEETRRGEWPWLVAIFTTSDYKFRCAGSLISRRHVVTAAHCVTDPSTRMPMSSRALLVKLGRYNLNLPNEEDEQQIAVDEILINPKYTSSKIRDYNIGLLKLKSPAIINKYVRTVCFWNEVLDIRIDRLISKVGLAPGWGKDENGVMAHDMKLARMPVVSQSVCVESDTDFYSAIISEKTFCAGFNNGTSLCNGDSGGGLYFYQENPKTRKMAWFVRGIVSLSKLTLEFSCDARKYVVFTDVASVLKWIEPRLEPPATSTN